MPVPSKMADLYTIASSNSPSGSEAIGNSLDDYLRSAFSILRSTNALSSFTLASASTVDLGTADAEHVQITGTATIASFGTSVPGLTRECRFTGALTITASTNIITPGGTDLAVAAGDILTFRSMGSGVWRAVSSCGAALVRDGALSIAKTSGLQTALDAKAPLVSPALTNGQAAASGASAVSLGGGGLATAVRFLPRASVGAFNSLVLVNDAAVIFDAASNGYGIVIGPATAVAGGLGLRIDGSGSVNLIGGLSVTGTVSITGNATTSGSITAGGNVVTNQNVIATTANLVLSPTGTGNVYIRPNGNGSGVGQLQINSAGDLVASGSLVLSGSKKLSKITVSSSAPGTLADGELYLRF